MKSFSSSRRPAPHLVLTCSALLAASVAAADGPAEYEPAVPSYRVSAGAPLTGDSWTRAIAGDFDNDRVPDVAQILETNTTSSGVVASGCVFFAPSTFQSPLGFGGSALKDIDVFREGGIDKLLRLDSNGLSKGVHAFNGSLPVAEQHSISFTAISSTYNWGTALMVRNATPTAATTTALIGVAANGTDLLVNALDTNSWSPTVVSVGAAIRELALIQWNGSGPLEIAVATQYGPRIYSSTGTPLVTFTSYPLESRIAAVHQAYPISAPPADRLAVVLTTGVNEQVLGIVRSDGSTGYVLEESVALGDTNVSKIGAGDMDHDGDDDLYLSNRKACAALVLVNARTTSTATATSFSASNLGLVELLDEASTETGAPDNVATPVLTDLDGDGDHDFFMGIPPAAIGGRDARVVMSDAIDANELRPTITGLLAAGDLASCTMTVERTAIPSLATHLELDAWYGAGSWASGPVTLDNAEISGAPAPIVIATVPTNQEFTFAIPYPNPTTLASLGLRLRFVKRNASTGALEIVYPALVGLLTNDNDERDTIEVLPGSGTAIDMFPDTDLPETVGGFVPRPKIGPYAGKVPKVN